MFILETGSIFGQVISIAIVIILFLSLAFSRKLHYFMGGLTLIVLGAMPILYDYKIIGIDINDYPVLNFAVYFTVVFAAKDLFKESMREKGGVIRWLSLIMAILLIVVSTLPTLYMMDVVSFNLPDFSSIIYNIMYIIAGVFLLVGIFTLVEEHRF